MRRRNSSPKWLPLNTALMTALANSSFKEWRSNPDIWGRLVEVAVGAHLVNEGTQHGLEVYYWRKGHYEVDFVVSKGRSLVIIEVKSGKRQIVSSGLELFSRLNKIKKAITVGTGGIELKKFFETPVVEWLR